MYRQIHPHRVVDLGEGLRKCDKLVSTLLFKIIFLFCPPSYMCSMTGKLQVVKVPLCITEYLRNVFMTRTSFLVKLITFFE